MQKLFYYFLMFSFVVQSAVVWANEHGDAHEAGIPVAVLYQAVNFFIILGGLVYFLRRPLAQYFNDRRAYFVQAAAKARVASEMAEKENAEIRERLNKLQAGTEESISRARVEATELKNQMIKDAHAISKMMREDTQRTILTEIEKAKHSLQQELIQMAFENAKSVLGKHVGTEEQLRLQSEFVEKIQEGPQ